MLSAASFNGGAFPIPDAQSASIDYSGTPQEYVSADSPDVKLVGLDRRAATVSVTTLSWIGDANLEPGNVGVSDAGPPVVGGLQLTLKPRAEGAGVQNLPATVAFDRAVFLGKTGGPVIEGSPSYVYTFRCYKTP
jgi:hypothetical protein